MTMSSGTYTNPASEFVEAVGGHGCLLSNRSCCCILFGVYESTASCQIAGGPEGHCGCRRTDSEMSSGV